MKASILDKPLTYPILIFFIWLVCYIACTLIWEQKLGWDEVQYMAVAKGIAEDFDFSGRWNTVLGIIKHPFPHLTNQYPIHVTYMAIFFKLFGVSLHVAYFSTWLAGLAACIFIYMTMLILTNNDKVYSFLTSLAFLFLPRTLNYCDTAMMEVPGLALVTVFTYFIFKDLSKGILNPFFIGFAAIFLYFFKSLIIGIVFGLLFLIIIAYKFKLVTNESKMSLLTSCASCLVTIGLIYFIFAKFIFPPTAPLINMLQHYVDERTYADFAGGFFNHPLRNSLLALNFFYKSVISVYFPDLPVLLIPGQEGHYFFGQGFYEFGIYLLTIFYTTIFLIFLWKRLSNLNKVFILFTLVSIAAFLFIYNLLAANTIGAQCRYNLHYVSLLLMSSFLLLHSSLLYKQYIVPNKIKTIFVLTTFIALVYVPFLNTSYKLEEWFKDLYSSNAHKSTQIVKKYVSDSKPAFIYYNTGTHVPWEMYPTRVINHPATNEDLIKVNKKLPTKIEYLFIQLNDKLFKENKDLILKAKPITNNEYSFYGFEQDAGVVVYKLQKEVISKKE